MLIPKQEASLFHFSFIDSASGLLYEICWFRFHDLSYLPRIYYIRTTKSEQLHGFGTCDWLLHIAFVFSFKYNGTLRNQPVFTAKNFSAKRLLNVELKYQRYSISWKWTSLLFILCTLYCVWTNVSKQYNKHQYSCTLCIGPQTSYVTKFTYASLFNATLSRCLKSILFSWDEVFYFHQIESVRTCVH